MHQSILSKLHSKTILGIVLCLLIISCTPTPCLAQASAIKGITKLFFKNADELKHADEIANATKIADTIKYTFSSRARATLQESIPDTAIRFEEILETTDAGVTGWYVGIDSNLSKSVKIRTYRSGDIYLERAAITDPDKLHPDDILLLQNSTSGRVWTTDARPVRISKNGKTLQFDIAIRPNLYVDSLKYNNALRTIDTLKAHSFESEDTKLILGFHKSEYVYYSPIEAAARKNSVRRTIASEPNSIVQAINKSKQKTIVVVAHQENGSLYSRPIGEQSILLGSLDEIRKAAIQHRKRLIVQSCQAGSIENLSAPLLDIRPSQVGSGLDSAFKSNNWEAFITSMSSPETPMRLDFETLSLNKPIRIELHELQLGTTATASTSTTAIASVWAFEALLPANDEEYRREPSTPAFLFGALLLPGVILCSAIKKHQKILTLGFATLMLLLLALSIMIDGKAGASDCLQMSLGCCCLSILPIAILLPLLGKIKSKEPPK
tara:strand:+ start:179 stop:1663 length:1485 start_codon:yes stop_codon:yes gene_type:complete